MKIIQFNPVQEAIKAPTKKELRAEFSEMIGRNIQNNIMKQYEKKKALRKQS